MHFLYWPGNPKSLNINQFHSHAGTPKNGWVSGFNEWVSLMGSRSTCKSGLSFAQNPLNKKIQGGPF